MYFPVISTQYISKCITINRRSIYHICNVISKKKNNTCTLFNKKPVFPTVWHLILTDRILKGWQCHVAKTKFILCFQSESHVVFFFVCVCFVLLFYIVCLFLYPSNCFMLQAEAGEQTRNWNRRWYAWCIEYLCIFVKNLF